MKIGIEVEGRLRGIKTIFIDHTETTSLKDLLDTDARLAHIGHIYISDIPSTWDESNLMPLGWVFDGYTITMEVTNSLMDRSVLPSNISLMLNVEGIGDDGSSFYEHIENLLPDDQVKFNNGLNVLCVSKRHFIQTTPAEFLDDTEI
jgi:hypothetical protein